MMTQTKKTLFKQIIAATSGTVLQWYDFSLFGYLTPIIAAIFFPESNNTAATLYTFGLFAVSFLLAPLGSIFFGYIGDNFGRKKALTMSVFFMAVPTAMIGLLPTYAQIGILAPILLTFLRIAQGFVASAEFAGSAVFLVEHSSKKRPYFLGSLTSSAYSLGLIIGSVISAIALLHFMPTYSWRIPFLMALLGGILIYYMRKNLIETPEFKYYQSEQNKNKTTFLTAVKKSPQAVILTMMVAWFVGIITFGSYVYSVTYITQYSHLDLSTTIIIVSVALLVDASLEPFIALLADKYDGRIISIVGIIGFALLSNLLFKFLSSGDLIKVVIGMLCFSCLIAITYAPLNTILVRLFPAEYRYSGFGVSFNLSIAIFGGTTPLLLAWLVSHNSSLTAPAMYYIFGSVIGLFSMMMIKPFKYENKKQPDLQYA